MQRLSAHFLVSALVLTACPADTNETTTTETSNATGSSSSGSSDGPTTAEMPTTGTPTTGSSTGDPTTDVTTTAPTTTTDPTTTDATTTDATTTDATTTDATTTDQTTGPVGPCGDGVLDDGEACDDGNMSTEISATKMSPLKYDAADCIDNCSLVLSLCGNGQMDPGEACDDGNQDSLDDCTTSCTVNDKDNHAPCKRTCQAMCDTDVTAGTFTGCDNMEVPPGAEAVCYVSTKFAAAPRYFAEGECAVTAQTCDGGFLCPPDVGDYDALTECPEGTTLVDRTTMALNITVKTKVCQKICETDSECRWNAFDNVWGKSGEYRCQTTPDSKGVKICADTQN